MFTTNQLSSTSKFASHLVILNYFLKKKMLGTCIALVIHHAKWHAPSFSNLIPSEI